MPYIKCTNTRDGCLDKNRLTHSTLIIIDGLSVIVSVIVVVDVSVKIITLCS